MREREREKEREKVPPSYYQRDWLAHCDRAAASRGTLIFVARETRF